MFVDFLIYFLNHIQVMQLTVNSVWPTAWSAFRISAPGIIDTDTLDLKEFAGDANYRQPLE